LSILTDERLTLIFMANVTRINYLLSYFTKNKLS